LHCIRRNKLGSENRMPGAKTKSHAKSADVIWSQDMRTRWLEAGSSLEHVARGMGVVEVDRAVVP
jgi:hypothetical protein